MSDQNTAIAQQPHATWSTQVHLAESPANLFRYLADFTSVRNWDPHVVDAQLETPGPIRVGSETSLQFRLGPSISQMRYHVVSLTPPTEVVLRGKTAQYEIQDRILIEPDPTYPEWSLVRYSLELTYKNPSFAATTIP